MQVFNFLLFIDDDEPTNVYQEVVVKRSQLVGDYRFFTSALDALSFLTDLCNTPGSRLPEAIFLDINIPRMNGWEFVEAFLQLSISGPSPRIVMLSTSNYWRDVERAQQTPGIDRLMTKPLHENDLIDLFEAWKDE
ncbi:MAG: response regulator [Bacteroidota bacterium]